jgi:hypothetical protein
MADKNEVKLTGRGGIQNFPNARPLDTDPGDNTKYLSHALVIRDMPPIDIADPVQVRNRINDYFALCAENDMKPTATGFRNALRIAKSTLWEWRQGNYRAGTHQAIICEAYDVLEALWEDYMQNGKINPVSGIFLGKNNFGYQDKQEYVVTPNTNNYVDPTTIEAKYKELPEE